MPVGLRRTETENGFLADWPSLVFPVAATSGNRREKISFRADGHPWRYRRVGVRYREGVLSEFVAFLSDLRTSAARVLAGQFAIGSAAAFLAAEFLVQRPGRSERPGRF